MPDTARYEQKLEAKDGLRLHVRPIRPEDEQLLYEAFERMSERSIYFRFFSPMKRLPHDLAQRLATVDYQDRFALVATSHLPDGHEHIVGVARYDRLQGTNMAEVAVAVIDEYQRRGIGAGLLSLLAVAADGSPAAVVWCEVEEHETDLRPQPVGLVSVVGTLPEHRRQGLAASLTAESLRRLRGHGARSASLYVDGLNADRAYDLYRRLGFEVGFQYEVFETPCR